MRNSFTMNTSQTWNNFSNKDKSYTASPFHNGPQEWVLGGGALKGRPYKSLFWGPFWPDFVSEGSPQAKFQDKVNFFPLNWLLKVAKIAIFVRGELMVGLINQTHLIWYVNSKTQFCCLIQTLKNCTKMRMILPSHTESYKKEIIIQIKIL